MMPSASLGEDINKIASQSSLPMTSGSRFGGSAHAIGASTDSVELQQVLSEEKLRSDQHRTNYQRLKAEHSKLQDAYARLENELTRATESSRGTSERHRRELGDAQKKLSELQSEMDELRQYQLTDQKLEMIKLQVSDELEQVYKDRFSRAQADSEMSRTEYNRARYELAFLKSEFEHQQVEHVRVLDEIKLIHEAEVLNLRQEREQLIARHAAPDETERLKALHRENTQLSIRVKSLTSELEELRAQRELAGGQMDQMNRNQAKQLSEALSACRQLEAQKESLKQQVDMLNRELDERRRELGQSTTRCHDLEKETTQLRNKLEEVVHKAQLDLSQLRLEAAKQRGEIERQRDVLANRLEDLEYKLQLSTAKSAQLEAAVLDREKEVSRREAAAREEEWEKVKEAEASRAELEGQLAQAERRLVEEESARAARVEHAEEKARQAESEKRGAESERDSLRRRVESAESELRELRQRLETGTEEASRREAELSEVYARLSDLEGAREERDSAVEDARRARARAEDVDRQVEAALAERESGWRLERQRSTARVRELEEEVDEARRTLAKLQEDAKRKKTKYRNFFKNKQHRLEWAEAKLEEIQTENDILKKNVSHEEFARVQRELKDMQRRHQEYRGIILAPNSTKVYPAGMGQGISDEERQHQESLRQLKDRLEQLDVRQQEQMAELMSFRVSPVPQQHGHFVATQSGPSGDA